MLPVTRTFLTDQCPSAGASNLTDWAVIERPENSGYWWASLLGLGSRSSSNRSIC